MCFNPAHSGFREPLHHYTMSQVQAHVSNAPSPWPTLQSPPEGSGVPTVALPASDSISALQRLFTSQAGELGFAFLADSAEHYV